LKVVTIKQGGKDWHQWRGKGIGASDAPAIMGESPWTSRFQLWGEKCGVLERPPFNAWQQAAVDKGVKLEPEARAWYEKRLGKKCPAIAGEHDTHSFIRASFDGMTEDLKHFIEIKCPGKDAHYQALGGRVPHYYMPQIQHQFLVSGCKTMDYVSYRDGVGVVVPVKPNLDYQTVLVTELTYFWNCVQNVTPPTLTNSEVRQLFTEVGKSVDKAVKSVSLFQKVLDQLLAPVLDGSGFVNVSK
jgi:putative phage-type endonuclease